MNLDLMSLAHVSSKEMTFACILLGVHVSRINVILNILFQRSWRPFLHSKNPSIQSCLINNVYVFLTCKSSLVAHKPVLTFSPLLLKTYHDLVQCWKWLTLAYSVLSSLPYTFWLRVRKGNHSERLDWIVCPCDCRSVCGSLSRHFL